MLLISYTALLWIGLSGSSTGLGQRAKRLVKLVAVGALAAGIADAAENYALIQLIRGGDQATLGLLASVLASMKFTFVGVALLVLALLGLRHLLAKRS